MLSDAIELIQMARKATQIRKRLGDIININNVNA
jgi:hypothetical protein